MPKKMDPARGRARRRGWRTSRELVPVADSRDEGGESEAFASEAWRDIALYADETAGPYVSPPWSPDRATQLKSRPRIPRPIPRWAHVILVLINLSALACVGYAVTLWTPRINDPDGPFAERVAVLGASRIVIAFVVLGLVVHVTTFAWRWVRRRRFPRRTPSRLPSFGTVFIAWAGIAALLTVVGSSQLAERGSTRLPESTSASTTPSASPSASAAGGKWVGNLRDESDRRIGRLRITLVGATVTNLSLSIDSAGCPKTLDLPEPTQIDPSEVRLSLGSSRDEALLKGRFQDSRFTGRLTVGICALDARATAAFRPTD